MDVSIRPAGDDDRDFILSLAPRLAAAARLPWRDGGDIARFQDNFMRASLAAPGSRSLIACGPGGERLGFVHVERVNDPVTALPCGYVSLLAVTEAAEGGGAARALMSAAEAWSRAQGFRLLCLDVFASNDRGRAFYARQGFGEETLRLVKELD